MTSKTIASHLAKTGLCICPDFLSARALARTADDLDTLRSNGDFRSAGVGRGARQPGETRIRNDETFWLDRNLQTTAQVLLWRKLDLLQAVFNRSLFLGLTDFEGHYAAYPRGGHYARHKDCFRGDSGRVVSFILYLNRDWKASDGGRLRVYGHNIDGGEKSHQDIDPVGGTMVCFMSSESEHEVLLSHSPRFSLAGWFKRGVRRQ